MKGFGLAIGSSAFSKISKHPLRNSDDLMCTLSHPAGAPWYQQTPSLWWGKFFLRLHCEKPGAHVLPFSFLHRTDVLPLAQSAVLRSVE